MSGPSNGLASPSPAPPDPAPRPSRFRRALLASVSLLGPIGFALAPILSVWSANPTEVSARDTTRPAGIALAVALGLVVCLLPVARLQLRRAAVMAAVAVGALANYGLAVESLLAPITTFRAFFQPEWVRVDVPILNGLCVVALVLALSFLRRRPREIANLAGAVALAGTALCLLPLPNLLRQKARPVSLGSAFDNAQLQRERNTSLQRKADASGRTFSPGAPAKTPDLFVIVLDAYGRGDILAQRFGIDNEPFLRGLEARGFSIARKSRANYIQTTLALASAFNLNYIQDLNAGSGEHGPIDMIVPFIDDSEITRRLKPRGYKVISIPTGTPLTAMPSADWTLDAADAPPPGLWSALETQLAAQSVLTLFPRQETREYDWHRQRLIAAFEHLPDAAALDGAKFVFAHILAPHPPFVFGPKGASISPNRPFTLGDATDFTNQADAPVYRRQYADQVREVNRRTLLAIDGVLARAKRPVAIVIMGDHGSRMGTNWKSLEKTDTHEAFSNLMAVRLSRPKKTLAFPDTITPINVLRRVLSAEFDMTDLVPLPNRSFYSKLQSPLEFVDVTRALDESEKDEQKTHETEAKAIPMSK